MSVNHDSDSYSFNHDSIEDEAPGTADVDDVSQERLLSIPLTYISQSSQQQNLAKVKQTNPPPRTARHLKSKHCIRSTTTSIWQLEIGACFLVVASVVSIVVVLRVVENNPLPTLPFSISINALIAVFVAIAQAATVFVIAEGIGQSKWIWFLRPHTLYDFQTYDNASRGPWGAIKLLWHLRGRPLIASLGALVLITAIILDPVSQQLIELYDCFENLPGSIATLPRTNYYDNDYQLMTALTLNPMAQIGLIGSAAAGQFSSSPSQPPFGCHTGNCTFPGQYSSVGYCSKCQNISSYLKVSNSLYTANRNSCVINVDLGPLPQYNQPGELTYISLAKSVYNFTFLGSLGATALYRNVSYFISRYDEPTGSVVMLWIDNALKLSVSPGSASNCSLAPQVRSSQCFFYSCVHTFESNISNSKLQETTIARDTVFGQPENLLNRFGSAADLQCIEDQAKESLSLLGYRFNATMRWIRYNVTWFPPSSNGPGRYVYGTTVRDMPVTPAGQANGFYKQGTSGWELSDKGLQVVPSHCIYVVQQQTVRNVEEGFASYWPSILQSTEETSGGLKGSPIGLSLYSSGFSQNGQDASDNISALFQNMSDSMTTFMRWHGNPNSSELVHGQTHHYAVCVGVRWAYLAYIATVSGLLIIFFISILLQSRRALGKEAASITDGKTSRPASNIGDKSAFHDFKSNALAVLFHGLDEQSKTALGDIGATNRVKELERESKEDKFVLVRTRQGWKLSRVNK